MLCLLCLDAQCSRGHFNLRSRAHSDIAVVVPGQELRHVLRRIACRSERVLATDVGGALGSTFQKQSYQLY